MNWNSIKEAVVAAVKIGTPIIATAFPEAAFAANIAKHLVEGVERAEPSAIALVNSIKSGEIPTNEQLEEYAQRYAIAHDALNEAIDEKLAELDAAEGNQSADEGSSGSDQE